MREYKPIESVYIFWVGHLRNIAPCIIFYIVQYSEPIIPYLGGNVSNYCMFRVLALILSSATEEDREHLRQYLEPIHLVLFDYVCVTPFEAARDALLTHYEVLKCFHSIAVLYPEEGLDK